MSRFDDVFPNGKVFLPVIHVENSEQALRNAEIAFENGADGIFLIGHGLPAQSLTRIYLQVREVYVDAWIGVNFLESTPVLELSLALPGMSGLWTDDGLVNLDDLNPTIWASIQWRVVEQEREKYLSPQFLYFGGVAFKGQKHVADVGRAAALAAPFMDVVTTSGPGTGMAADPEKLKTMKTAMGESGILGLASGATSENVEMYRDSIDVFLVASGISDSFTELSPKKTAEFRRNCR